MALVWSESCQWTTSSTRFNRRYNFGAIATIDATGGRAGGPAAGAGGVIAYPIELVPSGTTCVQFVRVLTSLSWTGSFRLAFGLDMTNTTNIHLKSEVYLEITTGGQMRILRGNATTTGTLLGETAVGFLSMSGVLYGIAIRVTIHGSTGTTEVLVDGVAVAALTLTGQNTSNVGSWNSVAVRSVGAPGWCDWMVLDGTNPTGNDPYELIPDVRVDYRPANGNGYLSEFTGSDADSTDNYLHVDETAVDDDTSYVEKLAAGIDAYAVANSPLAGATLVGVTHLSTWRKTDAGVVTAKHGIRASATNYLSSAAALPVSYVTASKCYGVNPAGGAWTEAGFNGIEGVIEKT